MRRFLLLGSAAVMIASCSSRNETRYVPVTGGTAGVGGADDGGSSSGGKGGAASGGSSSGGSAGKASGGSGGAADGGTGGTAEAGAGGEGGSVNDCPTTGCGPSCEGLPNDCGPNGDQNCCASIVVPSSVYLMGRSETDGVGDYFVDGDANEVPEHTATTLSIRIDTYEATLGRFEKFLAALPGSLPEEGDGAHPGIADSGWKAAYNPKVEDPAFDLSCGNQAIFWDPAPPETDRRLAMNCVSYYIAFAFCAWDGGFLPSEADWEAIAAGGDENRLYPWGATAPTTELTNIDCMLDGDFVCGPDATLDIAPVGSFSGDIGRYGHYDLGGNMAEWVLDAFTPDWYTGDGDPCTNCANPPAADLSTTDPRILKGGHWQESAPRVRGAAREVVEAADYFDSTGFYYGVRCARTL